MKQKWFYRLLYSYLNVFFVMISVLIVVFFFILSNQTQSQARKVNEIFIKDLAGSLDSALLNLDDQLTESLKSDGWIQDFMDKNLIYSDNRYVSRLSSLISNIPMADSIYLYRISDEVVMSEYMQLSLDQFGDRQFIRDLQAGHLPRYVWKGQRDYREFVSDSESYKVFSMVKYVGAPPEIKGIIVVNVKADRIMRMVEDRLGNKMGSVEIWDSDSNVLFKSGSFTSINNAIFGLTVSGYTGWRVKGGIAGVQLIHYISLLSTVWVIIGVAIILMGVGWIFIVTRRNYKPLASIIHLIRSGFETGGGAKEAADRDEFTYLESTFSSMIDKFEDFQQKLKEDSVIRKRYFFLQLVDGTQQITPKHWQQKLQVLNIDSNFSEIGFAVAEIDQYNDFCEAYAPQDQLLMKFALSNVMEEIAGKYGSKAWVEWVSSHQMAVMVFLYSQNYQGPDVMKYICDDFHQWIPNNLKLRVTVGVGGVTRAVSEIASAYQRAQESLKYKAILGANRVIGPWDIQSKTGNEMFKYISIIQSLVQSFRLGDPEWDKDLQLVFEEIRKDLLPKKEIVSVMSYLLFHFYKDTTDFPVDFQTVWNQHAIPQLHKKMEQFDMLEELHEAFREVLFHMSEQLDYIRKSRGNNELLQKIRNYIERNYEKSELSLLSVSEKFQISPSHLSRIFKESVGEKFVHFLTRIRIEHAKKMLQQCDDSIQDIAASVGYVHSFSFIRAFKKESGVTPGEFRKEN